MLYIKNGNPWSCSFQEVKNAKLLTDDARRRTKTNAIGYLGDSDDLKSYDFKGLISF